jgi:L-lactate dehydrogenase (cytochrome)
MRDAAPLESVAQAQRLARRRLPRSVYGALLSGVERGITRDNNALAFDKLGFIPRLADLGDRREQATTVLGQDLSLPVLLSPTGVQAVRPEGEVAVARAARAAGTGFGLSNFASRAIEDVVAANPVTFFQLYWIGSREDIGARVLRAKAAGARALIVTLDWALTVRRDWGSPKIPDRLDLRTILRFTPEGIVRPSWVLDFLSHGGFPDLTVPNVEPRGAPPLTFSGVYPKIAATKPPTWADIAWLRQLWGEAPFMVKGVMHPDDARRCVDAGATAISVSNHGGNNIDSTPASIRALAPVADAVGGQIEVLLDGGIRRGGDVVKALALGARAVMIGRAYLYAFAARGEAGVSQIIEVLRAGIHEHLLALGAASVSELSRDDLVIPDGFVLTRFPQSTVRTS